MAFIMQRFCASSAPTSIFQALIESRARLSHTFSWLTRQRGFKLDPRPPGQPGAIATDGTSGSTPLLARPLPALRRQRRSPFHLRRFPGLRIPSPLFRTQPFAIRGAVDGSAFPGCSDTEPSPRGSPPTIDAPHKPTRPGHRRYAARHRRSGFVHGDWRRVGAPQPHP